MTMSEIKTKIFNYGHEKEGTWPSQYGTLERGCFYIDENGETQSGYPPPRNLKFGDAPYIITDEIAPYRHPATGQVVDSKSKLKMIDAATNTITTDKKQAPDPTKRERLKREAKEARMAHLRECVQLVDSGNAPLTEDMKALCKARNKEISRLTGIDAQNIVGKKNGN